MDEELDAPAGPPPQRASGPGLVLALLAVTIVGGAAGTGFAVMQVDRIVSIAEEQANAPQPRNENALAWSDETAVARLDPVISNLAEPPRMFVRLDTAIVFDRDAVKDVERMKATVSEDILAFLRTLSLGELQGASAFNHLRDDLNDRVRFASGGTVHELVIETMVLQ
jgi:flagellar FliL protein